MKRKILLIICLTIVSLQIKAQINIKTNQDNTLKTNNDSNYHSHRYYIGLMSSLDFYNVKYNETDSKFIDKYQGYHYGIRLQYDITKKLSLRSGLSYSLFKYKVLQTPVIDPKYGFILIQDSMNINCWNVPVMLGYTLFSNGNFKITPSAGYILSFIKTYKESTNYYDNYLVTNTDNNLIIHSAQLNLGLEYLINNKFLITLEPFINFTFSEIDNEIYKSNTISFGGIFSINYHF